MNDGKEYSNLYLKPTGQKVYLMIRWIPGDKNTVPSVTAFAKEKEAFSAADIYRQIQGDVETIVGHSNVYEIVEAIPMSEVIGE